MAVRLEYTTINPGQYVSATSRYADSRVILLGENKTPALALYRKKPVGTPRDVQWAEITPSLEYRPDLVSYEVYGTPDFWWKIMELNNMKDILDFRAGRTILLPNQMLT